MSDSRASRLESIDTPSLHKASARTANLNTCTVHHHPPHMGTAFDHRHPRLAVSILKPAIPEHSLQPLYIFPAITKKKNHRQTQFPSTNPGTSRYSFSPWHSGAGCAVGLNHLARIPSDTLTQPLFLEALTVSPPNAE